jgi:hypothetical protein
MSRALRLVQAIDSVDLAETPPATAVAKRKASDNRTLDRVHRRADTNTAAVHRKVEEGALIVDGITALGARVEDRMERLINYGYDKVRAQQYEVDRDDLERVVQRVSDTTAEELERSLRLTAQKLREIHDRPLVVANEASFGEELVAEMKALVFARPREE